MLSHLNRNTNKSIQYNWYSNGNSSSYRKVCCAVKYHCDIEKK